MIFKGNVFRGSNARQGVDIISKIEGLDGGTDFLNSYTSTTVEGSGQAIDAALADMPNTEKGKVTARPATSRPKVMVGNSVKLIEEMIGPDETWYIENEQLYIVKNNEVTSSLIPLVTARTGL